VTNITTAPFAVLGALNAAVVFDVDAAVVFDVDAAVVFDAIHDERRG
jgi:hypothetical protein